MNEIERRAKHAQEWRLYLDIADIHFHTEWCICVGLYETSGWVNKGGHGMLEWIKDVKTFRK